MTDELETAPLPDPVPQPAPAEAAEVAEVAAAQKPAGRRRPVLGLVAQIAGVVGIVLCLVLAVGVVVGRGWATDTVTQVAISIDTKVSAAAPLLDLASQKVSDVSGNVGAVADAATAIAARPNSGSGLLQGLSGAVTKVSDRYLELRAQYGELKATITGALDRLQLLDRLIPGFSIPQGPIDALAKLDASITDLDAKIMGLANAIPETGPIDAAATAIATKAGDVQAKLDALVGVIDDVHAKLVDLRAQLASTVDTIKSAITVGSIVLVVFFLYLALLHWVLFRTGRQLRRGPAAV